MMTSMGGNRARGSWEQTQQGQTQGQTQHKQRPQATAEQIRLAQMISDHSDADFEEKVKQLIDITGKDQDESMIALHDCNGDINRAINVLLEGSPDTDSWEMVGKKKGMSCQKEPNQPESGEDGKENREKAEKEAARRRGGAPRRARATIRGREFRGQENGLDGGKAAVMGRGAERGRRGRGRGRGTLGAMGRRGGRFSAQGMGTFNPADYTEASQTDENYGGGSTWNNTGGAETEEGARLEYSPGEGMTYPPKFDTAPGAWRTPAEEWGTEDWNEDLSETKIFTASSVATVPPPQENVTITKGQRIDLAVLLGKTPPSSSSETEARPAEAAQPPSLPQSLVFSNSKQAPAVPQSASSAAPYAQHSMVSMLNKSFGEVAEQKAGTGGTTGGTTTGGTTGSQFLEQYKTAQALAQLAAQHSQTNANPPSWDSGANSRPQYDMKTRPESAVHAAFAKRPPFQAPATTSSMLEVFLPPSASSSASTLPLQTTSSPHAVPPPASSLPKMASVTLPAQQVSPSSSNARGSSPLPLQQHKLRPQKKRTSIATKIPATAVEMPGSADISGLNLQFGALQFGSEPTPPEYESASSDAAPLNPMQNSLYSAPNSESTPALSNSSQMDVYEQRASQTRRYPPSVSSSPQRDAQPKNGFGSLQAAQSAEAAAGSAVAVKSTSDTPAVALTDGGSGPASLLTAPNQAPPGAPGQAGELAPSAVPPPQHNSALSSQQNSLASSSGRTSNSSLLHPNMDGDSSLHSSSSFPSVSAVSSVPPSSASSSATGAQVSLGAAVSAPSGLGSVGNMPVGIAAASMGVQGVASSPAAVSISGAASAAPSSVTSLSSRSSAAPSGKAPPNLPPGVPPLLHNPYIMAPGLLHPYPTQVYGYDDLQMLQTRIPLDYYSIPFATPTTALTGREASLTNNPYSGDLSKFGRGDASSPAPATTLAQNQQQNQTQTHHSTQQPFLNPALPPGYSYTSLPYYTGMPGLANTFQYGPAVFPVAPTSSKQHGVNVGASATPFQQASGYGSHGYSTGVSVTSSNTGVPDISGSVYTKTQSFEKQGFHAGTPTASFSLPSALAGGGPINAPAAAGYAPAPFMHILAPHQQPHSQILHHHLQQDAQSGSGQRNQTASIQQKSQINKSAYNSYNWGAN
ncbi:ubiquitin-associated protein 2-like isoform X6 [Hippocampus zosterae]|uniref:ubiquitin-associated protein 2-like isoform X6 n=1 Tax=Hippocampus zosterae TaxID=109293 RepID=UPI00223CD9E8|nr:ubiquitin-associated protein 2-like isoform X6 [Hippocampus zosterae]